MALQYDVMVVGNYSIDLIFTGLSDFPQLGKDTIGTGFDMLPGEAYTPAVAMHRLGLKVGWAGDFGNDLLSRIALEFVRKEGLDESLFVIHDRPLRRVSASASFPEDRAFMTYYDEDPQPPAIASALPKAETRALYLPGLCQDWVLDLFLSELQERRIKLVMDGNLLGEPNIHDARVRRAIEACEVFLPNAAEARCLTGENDLRQAARILGTLCPLVAIKDGARGAWGCQQGQVIHMPAIPVKVLDTTGAGDCFSSGFVTAWLQGCSLVQCLQWGNIVGGLSTQKWGGTGERITAETVQQWLQYYNNSSFG